MMKKLYLLIFLLIPLNSFAFDKSTTFNKELFLEAQKLGKIVVINSWNKTCSTCAAQSIVLKNAKNQFKDVLFLSFEQTKDTDVAKFLNIDYWTTIVVYKDNKEIARSIGQTDKTKIYSIIQNGI
ncbi:thioredoxin family protein [Candidatus Pelagibacter sp.]|mgnify:CR=1 FL=1|nr:thioredoxin family protein [Candidatus Pelagibacter sp.]|tara:strand:+ start:953 stop:1327 length:375 start_codon:yes stop_codon:yes gene_type:complete